MAQIADINSLHFRFYTTAQMSEWLGMKIEQLETLRARGDGPRFYRIGRQIRYNGDDVRTWLKSCAVSPAAPLRENGTDCAARLMSAFHVELSAAPDGRPNAGQAILPVLDQFWPRLEDTKRLIEALASGPGDLVEWNANSDDCCMTIVPNPSFEGLEPGERVTIKFTPSTGNWVSTVAAPWHPGFTGLARHVFRLRAPGDIKEPASHRLLALIGAAAVKLFWTGGNDTLTPGAAPPLAPSLVDLARAPEGLEDASA